VATAQLVVAERPGCSAAHLAALFNAPTQLRKAIASGDFDGLDNRGKTPLALALEQKNEHLVVMLLDAGAKTAAPPRRLPFEPHAWCVRTPARKVAVAVASTLTIVAIVRACAIAGSVAFALLLAGSIFASALSIAASRDWSLLAGVGAGILFATILAIHVTLSGTVPKATVFALLSWLGLCIASRGSNAAPWPVFRFNAGNFGILALRAIGRLFDAVGLVVAGWTESGAVVIATQTIIAMCAVPSRLAPQCDQVLLGLVRSLLAAPAALLALASPNFRASFAFPAWLFALPIVVVERVHQLRFSLGAKATLGQRWLRDAASDCTSWAILWSGALSFVLYAAAAWKGSRVMWALVTLLAAFAAIVIVIVDPFSQRVPEVAILASFGVLVILAILALFVTRGVDVAGVRTMLGTSLVTLLALLAFAL
jgi:hypothetical protein